MARPKLLQKHVQILGKHRETMVFLCVHVEAKPIASTLESIYHEITRTNKNGWNDPQKMSKTLAILHQSWQEMGHQIQTYTSFHIIQHPSTFPPCFCQSLVALHHGPNPLTCGCVMSDSVMKDNSTSGRWPVAIPGVLHCRTYLRCLKQTLTLRHKASSSNIE